MYSIYIPPLIRKKGGLQNTTQMLSTQRKNPNNYINAIIGEIILEGLGLSHLGL